VVNFRRLSFSNDRIVAMDVQSAIARADSLLPGKPIDEGEDPRWQAIIAVGEYVETEPEAVWAFINRWGDHAQEDLRDAVATCLLEHLLEYHFSEYFPRVRQLVFDRPLFADMFQRCWKFGQSEEPANSKQFDELQQAHG
jgi:hypothetical protein